MTLSLGVPDHIGLDEEFGRAIFDRSKAKDAVRGKWHPKTFRERPGVRELSFDRTKLADLAVLSETHSAARQGQEFHGWAVIDHASACAMNRSVIADKLPDNPWHANVILPPLSDGLEAQDEEQRAHSVNLARRVKWLPKPTASIAVPPSA